MVGTVISAYWDSVTTAAFISAILALGLYFSNSAGALSVGHAAIAGMGGYLGAVLTTNLGWPFPAAVALGAALGLLVGAALAMATLRMSDLVAGLTTLAFGETMVVVVSNIPYIGGGLAFYGVPADTTELVAVVTLGVALVMGWGFERSRLGLAARAIRDNGVTAGTLGINVALTKVCVFALGAGLAAVAGVLEVHYVLVLSPGDLGFANSTTVVIMWLFGGSYVFAGPVVGALILTFVPELLRFSDQDRFMAYGLIVTAVIIFRPHGLVPRSPVARIKWLRAARREGDAG